MAYVRWPCFGRLAGRDGVLTPGGVPGPPGDAVGVIGWQESRDSQRGHLLVNAALFDVKQRKMHPPAWLVVADSERMGELECVLPSGWTRVDLRFSFPVIRGEDGSAMQSRAELVWRRGYFLQPASLV